MTTHTRGVAALVMMSSLLGCSASSSTREETLLHQASVASALTNGTADEADEAVVALAHGDGTVFCTGTLIAPRFVLTAAHCLSHSPEQIAFAKSARAIAKMTAHPDFNEQTLEHDLAVIELTEIADAAPVMYRAEADKTAQMVAAGKTVRLVGYGRAKAKDGATTGKKLHGPARIDEVVENRLLQLAPSPTMACAGDSGGPVFAKSGDNEASEILVGVTSFGDEECRETAFATRVASEEDFIRRVVEAPPPPPPAPTPEASSCSMTSFRGANQNVSFAIGMILGLLALARRSVRRAAWGLA